MRFHLGADTHWLGVAGVPLFVSHRRLARQNSWARAWCGWALDSGAFTEVAQLGGYTTTPQEYVRAIARYAQEIGNLEWAAPQDHMCEPWVLERSRIASTVQAAQRWTVDNFLTLRSLDPAVPVIPVLQGQALDDYWRHVDAYLAAGVDLFAERLVGVGSVCRRQATSDIAELIASLNGAGLSLHGFGVKGHGLRRYGWCLASADSMAWSYTGRQIRPCPHRGRASCSNCLEHAMEWRAAVLDTIPRPVQLALL